MVDRECFIHINMGQWDRVGQSFLTLSHTLSRNFFPINRIFFNIWDKGTEKTFKTFGRHNNGKPLLCDT